MQGYILDEVETSGLDDTDSYLSLEVEIHTHNRQFQGASSISLRVRLAKKSTINLTGHLKVRILGSLQVKQCSEVEDIKHQNSDYKSNFKPLN